MTEASLSDVVNNLELIRSIYFGDEEFKFSSPTDLALYDQLLHHVETNTLASLHTECRTIGFYLKVSLENDLVLVVEGRLSLADEHTCQLTVPSQQNSWLDRSQHQQLIRAWDDHWRSLLGDNNDDDRASQILLMLEQAPQVVDPMVQWYCQQQKDREAKAAKAAVVGPLACLREWLWLPMIYTKEKRGHIVDWAPSYGITGFLFAGKPGCLCLEGTEKVSNPRE
jgi:hypothetical protein